MCLRLRSKKMADLASVGQTVATGHLISKMVRIGPMARAISLLNRRELMAGLGAAALTPALPFSAMAQARPSVALQAKTDALALRAGSPDTQVWSLAGQDLRFRRDETVEVALANDL